MSTPEGAIVKQILDLLSAKHILAFRMNTGALEAEHNGKKRFMRFGVPGMADILAFPQVKIRCGGIEAVISPFPIWLEVKADKGKQSELQKSFEAQVKSEGHMYAVVRSIEDVQELLA